MIVVHNLKKQHCMKRLSFLMFGLIIINISACGQGEWKQYNFDILKIDFPQNPEYSTDNTLLDDSPLITHYWESNILDESHENLYYSVSYTLYPSDYIYSDSLFSLVEGFINSTQNDLLDDDTFTLLSSTLVERQGYPGKIFKWKNNSSNRFLEFQVFLVESTLFQLSVVSRAGENHNVFINKFFDSFEIINTPHGNFSIPEITSERTFAIDFPGEPKNNSRTVDSEYGKLALDIRTYEPIGQHNLLYIVMETKYPTQVANQNDLNALNAFYKKSIDGSINSVNGVLISIEDIYIQDKLGKEFRVSFSEGKALMVYRVLYFDNSMYMIGVITSPNKDNNIEMNKYFESFRILK